MKNKEIIEMAKQCFADPDGSLALLTPELTEFAKLVAEKERDACAKVCWKQMGLIPTQAWTVNPYEQCIDAIRARGQA